MPSQQTDVARWVFTFHVTEEEVDNINDALQRLGGDSTRIRFLIYQLELASVGGSLHFQGYVVLPRSRRFNYVKNMFVEGMGRDGIHLEPCRGTHEECVAYCSKEETRVRGPWRCGSDKSVGQGKRSDLLAVQEKLDKGASMRTIAREHFSSWCRNRHALAEYSAMVNSERQIVKYDLGKFTLAPLSFANLAVYWIYGPTGTGKTNYALAHFSKPLLVRHLDDLKSLDPTIHDGIVFDDMAFTHVPFSQVLNLTDVDFDSVIHCRFENAKIPAGTKRIFTHNTMNGIYPDGITEDQRNAIDRRVEFIYVPHDIRQVDLQ